jgi:hypothetical protein
MCWDFKKCSPICKRLAPLSLRQQVELWCSRSVGCPVGFHAWLLSLAQSSLLVCHQLNKKTIFDICYKNFFSPVVLPPTQLSCSPIHALSSSAVSSPICYILFSSIKSCLLHPLKQYLALSATSYSAVSSPACSILLSSIYLVLSAISYSAVSSPACSILLSSI